MQIVCRARLLTACHKKGFKATSNPRFELMNIASLKGTSGVKKRFLAKVLQAREILLYFGRDLKQTEVTT